MAITVAQPAVPRDPSHSYTGKISGPDGGWLCEVCAVPFYSDKATLSCLGVPKKPAPVERDRIWDAISNSSRG